MGQGTAVANYVLLPYALYMAESQSPFAFLGLALLISGVIGAGHILIERLVTTKLFSIFLTLTPKLLTAQFNYEPAMVWFEARSRKNLYDCWDISLIYLFLLSLILAMTVGFWVFLVLRILGIHNIRVSLLIIWFVLLCISNGVAAANQHAVEIKFQHRRATAERVKEYMRENPEHTLKRCAYYFLRNWVGTIFTTLKLLSTIVLFILLHWPAWLLRGIRILKIDLNDRKNREYYYITCAVLASVAGSLLLFFFR